jgi:uncharacterized protein (TIGR03118 family)
MFGKSQSLHFHLCLTLLLLLCLCTSRIHAQTAGAYQVTPLLSDGYVNAVSTDPNFINPWGFDNSLGFLINANGSGYTYTSSYLGSVSLESMVASANGSSTASPTGIVNVSNYSFVLPNNQQATYLVATLDGTISGWNSSLLANSSSIIAVNNSASNAVYTGLAVDATSTEGAVLLVANFGAGNKVEVYNQSLAPVTLAGSFTDPNLPSGYAPFDIHVINNQVYVTYALRTSSSGAYGATNYTQTLGPGNGIVSVFDLNGNFLQRAITGGNLNAPWGMAIAPLGFGIYGGDLLIGNFGDGLINVYDPNSYTYLGQVTDVNGNPILGSLPGFGNSSSFTGLWEINFGQGAISGQPSVTSSGSPNTLYFAAGVDAEQHGLFGSVSLVPGNGTTPGFAFSSSSSTINVTAGQSASATIAIDPIGGYSGAVTLSCFGLPANTTCSFSNSTVTLNGNAPATTTLTINTNVNSNLSGYSAIHASALPFAAVLLCGMALLPFTRRNLLGNARILSMLIAAILMTGFLSGCGSSSTTSATSTAVTPSGTTPFALIATSGSITQTSTITLKVQ